MIFNCHIIIFNLILTWREKKNAEHSIWYCYGFQDSFYLSHAVFYEKKNTILFSYWLHDCYFTEWIIYFQWLLYPTCSLQLTGLNKSNHKIIIDILFLLSMHNNCSIFFFFSIRNVCEVMREWMSIIMKEKLPFIACQVFCHFENCNWLNLHYKTQMCKNKKKIK